MRPSEKIKDYMTSNPVIINVETSTFEAFMLMEQYDLRHLPVEKDGKLVGILSERDILKARQASSGDYPVTEVAMTPNPYVVEPDERMETVLSVMAGSKIGCVVIRKPGEKISGIFTSTDALQVLAVFFRGSPLGFQKHRPSSNENTGRESQ